MKPNNPKPAPSLRPSDAELAAKAIALLQEVGPDGLSERDFAKWHPRVRDLLEKWNDRGPVLTLVTYSEIELTPEAPPLPETVVQEVARLLDEAGFRHVETRVLTSLSDPDEHAPRLAAPEG